MSKPAIVVENLSKSYRLGLREKQHQSFREALTGMATAPFRRLRELGEQGTAEDTFWALKDVNFEVQPGEVVGIIGRNGAGKSTLLKVLSRIVEPTSGRIRLRGRVASLLEVGTGFHPELSGRENIYMNGSILGMRKAEIDRKFDEIVAFAEVEKFLDTPVKRYSSGMYVRLAFAVAAHLEPEILIVDEVLAVGDAEFQKKCLGKMKEVSDGEGRTVLFVSHNMGAVSKLCDRGVLLSGGRLAFDGDASQAVVHYSQKAASNRIELDDSPVQWVEARQEQDEVVIRASYRWHMPLPLPCLGFVIYDSSGSPVCGCNPQDKGSRPHHPPTTQGTVTARFASPQLVDGTYSLTIWFGDGSHDLVRLEHCVTFDVLNMAKVERVRSNYGAPVIPECDWTFFNTVPSDSCLSKTEEAIDLGKINT